MTSIFETGQHAGPVEAGRSVEAALRIRQVEPRFDQPVRNGGLGVLRLCPRHSRECARQARDQGERDTGNSSQDLNTSAHG
jgi:hypothetical protein